MKKSDKKPKNECDGVVSAPPGALSTGDVLGKGCDHRKDGFFGKDCNHIPKPLFKEPMRRTDAVKKKRKKKLEGEQEFVDEAEQQYSSKIAQDIGNLKASKIEMDIARQNNLKFGAFKLDSICYVPAAKVFLLRLAFGTRFNYVISRGFDQRRKQFIFNQNSNKTSTTRCTVDQVYRLVPGLAAAKDSRCFVLWGEDKDQF